MVAAVPGIAGGAPAEVAGPDDGRFVLMSFHLGYKPKNATGATNDWLLFLAFFPRVAFVALERVDGID